MFRQFSIFFFISFLFPNPDVIISDLISEDDPFLDFKAVNRIGFYLSLLLKYSHEELEKDIIIGMANDEYSREFGKDKVASIR